MRECVLTDKILEKIEHYVVLLYSRTSKVNEARQKLFVKGTTRSLQNIPPTQGALVQHAVSKLHIYGDKH